MVCADGVQREDRKVWFLGNTNLIGRNLQLSSEVRCWGFICQCVLHVKISKIGHK